MRSNVRVYQKKIIERRRKRALFFSIAFLVIAGLVLGGLSWLSRIDAFRVTTIRIEGAQKLKEAELAAAAEAALQGSAAFLFPRSNILFYPDEALARELAAQPLINEVRVEKKGLHEIVISVIERQEEARFCLPAEEEVSRCFSLDEDGFAYDPIELTRSDMSLVFRDPSVTDPLGKQFLTPEVFRNLLFFARQLAGTGANPTEIELGEAGYMTVTLEGGGRLIMNMFDDLSDILANVAAVLSDRAVASSAEEFLSKLDYMRLDAGNKIFYKLKD